MNRGSYFPLFLLNDRNEKYLLHSIISSNLLEDYDCPDGWLAVDGADHGHFISVILTKSPGFNCLNIWWEKKIWSIGIIICLKHVMGGVMVQFLLRAVFYNIWLFQFPSVVSLVVMESVSQKSISKVHKTFLFLHLLFDFYWSFVCIQ